MEKVSPETWENMDWSRRDGEIAKELGITIGGVAYQRKRRGEPAPKVFRVPAHIWMLTSHTMLKHYNARTPDELFIMQEYANEIRQVQKTEWAVTLGGDKVWRPRGWRFPRYYKTRKEHRVTAYKNMRDRMNADPQYREHKLKLWRARDKKKAAIRTEKQRAARQARARAIYHTRQKHDPKWRVKHNLRVRLYKFLFGHKSLSMPQLLGCSQETLIKHLESHFRRGMNWENYGSKWEIDHIIPCSSFDLTNPDEQKKCFHFSNLRPMPAIANRSKGAKRVQCQPELLLAI